MIAGGDQGLLLRGALCWFLGLGLALLPAAEAGKKSRAPKGQVVSCDLALGEGSCPKSELHQGGVYVIDNFVSQDDLAAFPVFFDRGAEKLDAEVFLNATMLELRPPRLMDFVRDKIDLRLTMKKPWQFNGRLYRDHYILRRYLSTNRDNRQVYAHMDATHPGRCLSAGIFVGTGKKMKGGTFQTHRCSSKECTEFYAACRQRDITACTSMESLSTRNGSFEIEAEVPYKSGRAVFWLAETLHSVTELTAGVRDLVFIFLSCYPTLRVAIGGDVVEVREALAEGGDVAEVFGDGVERQPLHQASERGFVDVVETLLAAKANPEAKTTYGEQPLHSAAEAGHAQVAQLLMMRSASPAAKFQSELPIDIASRRGHRALLDTFAFMAGKGPAKKEL